MRLISRSPLASLGSLAGLALALSACADPLSPSLDAGIEPMAATGSDVSQPLRETFGSGMEQSAGRDTRVDVNSGAGGTFIDAYVLTKNVRWVDPIAGTSWIGPRENSNVFYSYPQKNDEYQTTFNLPLNATSPTLNIQLWSDNAATVYVNGEEIGQQPQTDEYSNYGCNDEEPANTCSSFATTPFLYTTAGEPVTWNYGSSNTLRIVVLNAEFKQGCANVVVVTPECASASGLDFLAQVRYGLRGDQGCSLGFWKNKGAKSGLYNTSTKISTVFTSAPSSIGNLTLLQGLNLGGGGINALTRQAVAAYLNSVNVNYPLTTQQVKDAVNAAYASGNYNTLASQLDEYNNLHNAPICRD